MEQKYRFSGIIPANLIPFNRDYSVNERDYRKHLKWLADAGVSGIVLNGHAAEVSSLSRDERRRALAVGVDEVGSRVPLIAGIFTDSTLEARELAKDAQAEGASGLLVFPPSLFIWGVKQHPEMARRHMEMIADAVDLPLIAFEYPVNQGWGYDTETLVKVVSIPQVVAVKEWSNDIVSFERNLRAIRATGRPVAILSSFTMSLFASFALGADGAISGMGSVVADLQVELFNLVKKGELEKAQALNDRLSPLVRVFYSDPFLDMHNRMKEALAILGRIEDAVVRPPLYPIGEEEKGRIRRAIEQVGLVP